MKDCTTCPSYIPASDSDAVRLRFGRATGTAMCGRHGHLLSLPYHSEEQARNVALAFGSKCDDYGKEIPAKPVQITPRVVKPEVTSIPSSPAVLPSCAGCEHFVEGGDVAARFDLPLGMCDKKGIVIFKANREAKDCPVASDAVYAGPPDRLAFREVIPELSGNFEIDAKVLLAGFKHAGVSSVDPSEYPTDKPVTPDDDAAGIRAWRAVEIEGRGKTIYLPIFKKEHFTEQEQAMIPKTGGEGSPELFIDYNGILPAFAVIGFMLDFPFVMEGEPGTGKTEGGRYLAWLHQMPFHRIQITRDTPLEDLIGKPHVEAGTDYFEKGRIPMAWESDCFMGVDEWNVGEEVIGQFFRSMFDDSKQLVLDANRGEVSKRAPYSFPVLTQNPSWDIRNIGTNAQAAADVSRGMFLKTEMPPEALCLHIMAERVKALDGEVPDMEQLKLIYAIGQDIRSMASEGTYPYSWGVREYIKVARLVVWYDVERAFKFAALNAVEPEVTHLVERAIRDRLP